MLYAGLQAKSKFRLVCALEGLGCCDEVSTAAMFGLQIKQWITIRTICT